MIRVGVLRGGTGNQYDMSLSTGAYIVQHLPRERYAPVDIFVDRDGAWHIGGVPISYDVLQHRVDVIWNSLHGFYGEDGKVQQLLENLAIPYIGTGPLSSAITMNKKLAKEQLAKLGIKTPRGIYIEEWGNEDREETVLSVASAIAKKFSPPWMIEPISRGLAQGPIKIKTRDELSAVLFQMFDLAIPVLVEEAVLGKDVSVSTVSGFRGQPLYTFLPVHTDAPRARLLGHEKKEVQKIAEAVHRGLMLGHYLHMHATLTPKGQVYVASIDTIPALHEGSALQHSLAEVGASFAELADHLIREALRK